MIYLIKSCYCQRCTVDLELRELERSSVKLNPTMVLMEGDTVLTQYIITKWALVFKNQSKFK